MRNGLRILCWTAIFVVKGTFGTFQSAVLDFKRRRGKHLKIWQVYWLSLAGSAAVGWFGVVGQMLRQYGNCAEPWQMQGIIVHERIIVEPSALNYVRESSCRHPPPAPVCRPKRRKVELFLLSCCQLLETVGFDLRGLIEIISLQSEFVLPTTLSHHTLDTFLSNILLQRHHDGLLGLSSLRMRR